VNGLEQVAFKMHLLPGCAAEYKRRHDAIWPELSALLHQAGISDYSIFLDEETHTLFAVLRRNDGHQMDQLPKSELMQRWWHYMADLMRVESDQSPVQCRLTPVFHLD
jgi:L-rhamnose mutarotase